MSDFVIPKGKDYTFTIKVMASDSFLAQDLTNLQTATMTILNRETQADTTVVVAMVVDDALNGILKGIIASNETDKLSVERSDKVDGYYLKAPYSAYVEIKFNDGTNPIHVTIDEVYVTPTGV